MRLLTLRALVAVLQNKAGQLRECSKCNFIYAKIKFLLKAWEGLSKFCIYENFLQYSSGLICLQSTEIVVVDLCNCSFMNMCC